jgi:internalin A
MTYQAAVLKIEQARAEQWEELDLSGMGLTEVPPEIGGLGELRRLFLGRWDEEKDEGVGNPLVDLPGAIGQLQQLEELHLYDTKITVIPELIAKLKNLRKLNLAKNEIAEVPVWVSELVSLTEIDLWGNQISIFPDAIMPLNRLTKLNLGGNRISEIPAWIGSLINLTELYLWGNQITILPSEIAQLSGLIKLGLGTNQISEIPEWIGSLMHLTELSLYENQITVMPNAIAQLTNLTLLGLRKNQISEIPDWIGSLSNLTELYLSENQIIVLPNAIEQLTRLTKLYLSKNQISAIPDWIGSLSDLTELYLSENQIAVMPSAIAQLTNLNIFVLGGNQISEVPNWIGNLTKLTELYLWGNNLAVMPNAIEQLTRLTKLDLSLNQISVIPDWIGSLSDLTELDLQENQITVMPSAIAALTSLTKLSLGTNQISEIPNWIGSLTNLMELNLSENQIMVLPNAIAYLSKLTKLIVRANQIIEIPEWIGSLSNLTELRLSGNQITVLPNAITRLTSLTHLSLGKNQISEIPNWIGSLTNLTHLHLNENQIIALPSTIAQLTNLTQLYLWSNQISEIPHVIAQLTSLTIFSIGTNQISEIPDWIGSLTNLTELYLSSAQIVVIPSAIAQLTNLTKLSLRTNQISEIPDWIGSLTNLTELDLSKNQIKKIGNWIANLRSLELLDLAHNQIRELPEALKDLEALNVLRLSDNPLSIPSETLRQGWGKKVQDPGNPKSVLDYYFTTRDPEQTATLYEAKLLLVGEGGSGKTSLANKLINPDYQLKPETEDTSTQGIDILDWKFTGTNGQNYTIHIWDFGGQAIYHQTHQFFLTERACYLLVADSRKENTDHYFWLQSIQLLGKNSPVHLIQNEKQNRDCTLNSNQLRGEFANLRDTHRTNLNDNRGLPDLQAAIQQELERLIPNGIPFPNKWLAVRYSLENDPRNYIETSEYETLCRSNKITDQGDMLNLSRFLHELGILLHFQKDPILKHRLILKPNWGTAAVYKILDNPTVRQNLGQFSSTDLDNIWADAQYTNMRDELLQLMKEFKVCYEIPRRKGQYIAPHLLSAESPIINWNPDQNLILRYDYKNFMPKGILTRFIVEMHNDIENVNDPENALVWKTGVVLINGPTRAEITEHYYQRKIHIRVSGPRPRDFLTIITRKFAEIHHEFYDDTLCQTDPPFSTLIPCNCPTCKPNPEPYLFTLDRLHTYLDRNALTIQCYESGDNVQVRGLIDSVIEDDPCDEDRYDEDRYGEERYYPDNPIERFSGEPDYDRGSKRPRRRSRPKAQPPIVNVAVTVPVQNTNQQATAMTDQSQKTTTLDLRQATVGAIATDSAQATVSNNTFTQNNNATTADLLHLITALRQTATQFPQDIQEDFTIEIDDIEAEIIKPEADRSSKKLAKRLTALFLAASTAVSPIAGPIAGMADFTNNLLELGEKLHIEMPQLKPAQTNPLFPTQLL